MNSLDIPGRRAVEARMRHVFHSSIPALEKYEYRTTKLDIQHLRYVLNITTFTLNNVCNVTNWVMGGTLLGIVRQGDLLEWDDDADVGILGSEVEQFEACAKSLFPPTITYVKTDYVRGLENTLGAMMPSKYTAHWMAQHIAKLAINREHRFDHKFVGTRQICLSSNQNISIDIFPFSVHKVRGSKFFRLSDPFNRYLFPTQIFPYDIIFPIHYSRFTYGPNRSYFANGPNLPRAMLSQQYGRNWMTPRYKTHGHFMKKGGTDPNVFSVWFWRLLMDPDLVMKSTFFTHQ